MKKGGLRRTRLPFKNTVSMDKRLTTVDEANVYRICM